MKKVKLHEIIAHCACAGYSAVRYFNDITGHTARLPPWEQLPESQKFSEITITLVNLSLGEPGFALLHDIWLRGDFGDFRDLVFFQRARKVWEQFDITEQLDAEDKALWEALTAGPGAPGAFAALTTIAEKATLFANGGAQAPLPDSAPNGPPSRVSRG